MARPPITKAHPYTPGSGAHAGETFTTERAYRATPWPAPRALPAGTPSRGLPRR